MLGNFTVRFQKLFRSQRQISHVLLTRPLPSNLEQAPKDSVRFTGVKRAESVLSSD